MSECDHCGAVIEKSLQPHRVSWCGDCVFDDVDILNGLGLLDSFGHALLYQRLQKPGPYSSWGLEENVRKIKSVPKKVTKAPSVVEESNQAVVIEEPIGGSFPNEPPCKYKYYGTACSCVECKANQHQLKYQYNTNPFGY